LLEEAARANDDLEQRVQELAPELGLIVAAGAVRIPVPVESLDEIEDFLGRSHTMLFSNRHQN
ncbi:MAG: hypothetical protein ACE5FJ_04205, partial [Gemmatimonadales bacterium]